MNFHHIPEQECMSACPIFRLVCVPWPVWFKWNEALAHARLIAGATDLPVSADLEHGFGDAPTVVAETVRLAGEAGLVGCTIEDTTSNPGARSTSARLRPTQ